MIRYFLLISLAFSFSKIYTSFVVNSTRLTVVRNLRRQGSGSIGPGAEKTSLAVSG